MPIAPQRRGRRRSLPVPAARARPAHVLVIDDDVLIRALIAGLLRSAGLCVVEAGNADEAWSYVQSGAPVDLLFSDVEMPGSMNGGELAHRVRERDPGIEVILTSGSKGARFVKGFTFLPKPYRLGQALAIVLDALGTGAPDRS
jgi:two-component system, response regulator PdtaR